MIIVSQGIKTLRRYCDGDNAAAHFYAKGHSMTVTQPVHVYYQGNEPNTRFLEAAYIDGRKLDYSEIK